MRDRLGRRLRDVRVRAVLPHVRGRLLDLGCGENALVRAHGEGIGVDVHPWPGVDLVVEDTSRLPFDDAAFDTVTVLAALNHIPDRAAVLREARRVLRPGGRFVATMIPPRLSAVWHFARRPWDEDQRERGMRPGEVWGISKRDMRRLLAEAGFRLEVEERFALANRVYVARR